MPPPPNYEQTLKNDRRCMSAIETSTTQQETSRRPTEVIVQMEQSAQETSEQQQTSNLSRRDAIRRVQSNVEATPPASNLGPPAYSRRLVDR
jgi:hypothetical protein